MSQNTFPARFSKELRTSQLTRSLAGVVKTLAFWVNIPDANKAYSLVTEFNQGEIK